ncbi:glycosyltransferase [Paenibacillus sp. SC116]|uniref:tetratricopeptide repeat-containing glycosyltransferase family 2 protein n=1 Tax=Paenibacillus sp. SC116 TaxID=2968986 RepID=UPI00215B0DBD|nr:TPR domain-containing glycosyltransferase [Paenibacillus sp. SC116]MCR8844811.1 glycosyltransferase [Paenibacillus sp. SC116]
MPSSTVSLCMIVKNEEQYLERCLKSVEGIVDEIIIVDTGSTDQTKYIASKYTNRIYDFDWNENFSEARNFAIQHATSNYILQLDADEVLVDDNNDIRSGLDKDFYQIRIRNKLASGNFMVHQFIRLFRNIPEYKYEGALHEQIKVNPDEETWALLSCMIDHDGYQDEVVASKGKIQRNRTIIMNEIEKDPSAFNYHNLGSQYMMEENYTNALEAFKKSYSLGSNYTFSKKVVLEIMFCLMELNRVEEAIQIGEDIVQIYSESSTLHYVLGMAYMHVGYFKDAERCFIACTEIDEDTIVQELHHYEGANTFLAWEQLASIYMNEGDREQANRYLVRAIQAAPDSMALLERLLNVHLNTNPVILLDLLIQLWPQDHNRYVAIINHLYTVRHPVLSQFLYHLKINVAYPASVFVHIIRGSYEQAGWKLLEHEQSMNIESIYDIVLLSVLQNNAGLWDRYKNKLGLDQADSKWLDSLLMGGSIKESEYSPIVIGLWRQLVKDLLHLQKYDEIERLMRSELNAELRYTASEQFFDFGFYELALDIITESSSNDVNYKVYMLAGKSLERIGSIEDANYYYKQANRIHSSMETLYPIWRTSNTEARLQVIKDINKLSIQSKWIQ